MALLKTSFKESEEAFKLYYNSVKNCNKQQILDDLILIFENENEWLYTNFMASFRMKAHSVAFHTLKSAVSVYLKNGYYLNNEHLKKLVLKYFQIDYKEFLKDLANFLENERKEILK